MIYENDDVTMEMSLLKMNDISIKYQRFSIAPALWGELCNSALVLLPLSQ